MLLVILIQNGEILMLKRTNISGLSYLIYELYELLHILNKLLFNCDIELLFYLKTSLIICKILLIFSDSTNFISCILKRRVGLKFRWLMQMFQLNGGMQISNQIYGGG